MLYGDERKDEIVCLLLTQLRNSPVTPDELAAIESAATQIQAATDLLFHGAMTTMDEQPRFSQKAIGEFVARMIIAEVRDHGFTEIDGNAVALPRYSVHKSGSMITSTWKE